MNLHSCSSIPLQPQIAELGVPYILMHSYGSPGNMVGGQERLRSCRDIVEQVAEELGELGKLCVVLTAVMILIYVNYCIVYIE